MSVGSHVCPTTPQLTFVATWPAAQAASGSRTQTLTLISMLARTQALEDGGSRQRRGSEIRRRSEMHSTAHEMHSSSRADARRQPCFAYMLVLSCCCHAVALRGEWRGPDRYGSLRRESPRPHFICCYGLWVLSVCSASTGPCGSENPAELILCGLSFFQLNERKKSTQNRIS